MAVTTSVSLNLLRVCGETKCSSPGNPACSVSGANIILLQLSHAFVFDRRSALPTIPSWSPAEVYFGSCLQVLYLALTRYQSQLLLARIHGLRSFVVGFQQCFVGGRSLRDIIGDR